MKEEYAKVEQSIQKPNILIAGATGVGKSSIINMVFGAGVAVVGTGKPITQKIDVYENDKVDVRIYDSKGYEVESNESDEFLQNVVELAKRPARPEEAIHLVWYCISAAGGRVTDYDSKAINTFVNSGIPVAVIFTKADLATNEEIAKMKTALGGVNANVFETTTSKECAEYNQLKDLINWSINKLPTALRYAFVKSQKISLEAKKKEANKYIAQHCSAAFGVGFSPIPMSDAPLLVANEVTLIARILYLYELKSVSEMMKSIGISTIIGTLASCLGKSAVASLIKLIPGIGTIFGGVINGSVGSLITAAIGKATSVVAYKICNAELAGEEETAKKMLENFGPMIMECAKGYIESGKKKEEILNE